MTRILVMGDYLLVGSVLVWFSTAKSSVDGPADQQSDQGKCRRPSDVTCYRFALERKRSENSHYPTNIAPA
jgi:hypothetical protein